MCVSDQLFVAGVVMLVVGTLCSGAALLTVCHYRRANSRNRRLLAPTLAQPSEMRSCEVAAGFDVSSTAKPNRAINLRVHKDESTSTGNASARVRI